MCNCGKKRNEFTQRSVQARPLSNLRHTSVNTVSQQPTSQRTQTISFQYTGNTALTVTGNVTRRTYRFNFPGDIQHVALSDAGAMNTINVLKRI